MGINVIPARALNGDFDAELLHLIREFRRKRLAHRVVAGVIQIECSAHAILFANTIGAGSPAGLVKKLLGISHVGLDLHIGGTPRRLIAHAVRRRSVAIDNVFDHGFAVYAIVDGATHGNIVRHRIAYGVCNATVAFLGTARLRRGKGNAARVHRLTCEQFIVGDFLVGIHGGGKRDVDLAGASGGESRIFLHERDHDALHFRLFAIVVGVRLQNNLLALVPLLEHVAA